MAFKIQSLEHLVNIVVKNLRGAGLYDIPKERMLEELEWCWNHIDSELTVEKSRYYHVQDPVNTVTWESKNHRGPLEFFIRRVRRLKKDYEIFYKVMESSEEPRDLDNVSIEIPPNIVKRVKLKPLEFTRNRTEQDHTEEYVSLIERSEGRCGNYFLYDGDENVIYVGRSVNLGMRAATSVVERGAEHIEIAFTDTQSDAAVYENYYISKLKPEMNVEGNYSDTLSITLPDIREYKVTTVYKKQISEKEDE